jgi:TonB family protein
MIALVLILLTGLVHAQQATPPTDALVPTEQWAAKGISPPKPINQVEAEFSDDARLKHISGVCLVSLIVDTEGNPQNPRIIHCTDSSFEQSSLDAVKQYKFQPAATQEGKPVPVLIHVEINYRLVKPPFVHHSGKAYVGDEISTPIHYSFNFQQGGASLPDADGIHPLTRSVTGPRVIEFSDEGYGKLAFVHEGNSACDVVLTINTKGKASDPQVTHCERPELEKPVVASLLKSEYTPGFVNGKIVPMRATIHLEYGDVSPKP